MTECPSTGAPSLTLLLLELMTASDGLWFCVAIIRRDQKDKAHSDPDAI